MFTNHQNCRALYEIGVGEHDGDVRFLTGSSNVAVLSMRNEQYAIWPLFKAESPKFPKKMFCLARNWLCKTNILVPKML